MQRVKIVVSGAFNAGKSQFVKTISDIPVISTERRVSDHTNAIKPFTTAALDFGRYSLDDETILYLYGTPGQERFDFMWSALAKGMRGLVIVVDSTAPRTVRATRHIINYFAAISDTPAVIAANKQDHPEALSPEALRETLRIPAAVPVIPCVAIDRSSVAEVLHVLAGMIAPIARHEIDDEPNVVAIDTDTPRTIQPIHPQGSAPLAAVSLRDGSNKHHLTRGGGTALCGRSLGAHAVQVMVFGPADCQTCARSAHTRKLVCVTCGRPLVRTRDGMRCLGCTQAQRQHNSEERAWALDL